MQHHKKSQWDNGTLYTQSSDVGDESELIATETEPGIRVEGQHIVFQGSRIDRARIGNAPHIRIVTTQLDTVDAANADLSQSFWREMSILGSRFTGVKLNGAMMTDVTISESRLNLAQMQETRLKRVRFEDCDLRGAFFNNSVMRGTVFAGSDLTGSDFSGADIGESDLRRAVIEGIRIAPDQLRGVIVTPDQALYLATLMGLDIQE